MSRLAAPGLGLRLGPDAGLPAGPLRAGPPSASAPPRDGGLKQPAASGADSSRLLRTAAALALLQPVRRRLRARTARAAEAEAAAEAAEASASFEVVPLEGRGLGAVALRDVARGELVAAERPLLEFNTEAAEWSGLWRASVREQFDALAPEVQRAVMELHDAEAEISSGPASSASLEGVVRTNSFVREGEDDSRGGVVCLKLSRFNHSCAPNCEASWSQACGEKRIYASSDVKAGEELCIFYADPRASRGQRQAELQGRYGFECRCSACSAVGPASEESDRRRARMGELDEEIALVSAQDPLRGLRLCQELLDLYDEEGIQTQSFRKRACYYMFQLSLLLKDPEGAGRWAERALEHAKMCHGLDHEDTQRLQGYASDVSSHPAYGA